MTRADRHELSVLLFVAAVLALCAATDRLEPDAASKPNDCTVHGSQR